MAKVLPFPPTPKPRRKPRRKAPRGLSHTLRVDTEALAEALMERLQGKGMTDSDSEEAVAKRLLKDEGEDSSEP